MSAIPVFENSEIDLRRVRDTGSGEPEWEFVCECSEKGCQERVFLTLDAYIALREDGGVVLAESHGRS